MPLNNSTLNNVINFIASEFVNQFLDDEEKIDEYIQFTFHVSREFLIKEATNSMMDDRKTLAVLQMDTSKENLIKSLGDFIKEKNIINEDSRLVPYLFDEECKTEQEFKEKYNVSLQKATQVFDLRNSII